MYLVSSPQEPWSSKHTLLAKAKLLYKKWTTSARERLQQHLAGRLWGSSLSTSNQPASQRPCVCKWGKSTLHSLYTVLQDPAHDTSAGARCLRKKSPEGNLSRASSQFNFITVLKAGSCLLKAAVLVWVPAPSKSWPKDLERCHLFGRLILRCTRGRVSWWREVTKGSRGWDLQQVCIVESWASVSRACFRAVPPEKQLALLLSVSELIWMLSPWHILCMSLRMRDKVPKQRQKWRCFMEEAVGSGWWSLATNPAVQPMLRISRHRLINPQRSTMH